MNMLFSISSLTSLPSTAWALAASPATWAAIGLGAFVLYLGLGKLAFAPGGLLAPHPPTRVLTVGPSPEEVKKAILALLENPEDAKAQEVLENRRACRNQQPLPKITLEPTAKLMYQLDGLNKNFSNVASAVLNSLIEAWSQETIAGLIKALREQVAIPEWRPLFKRHLLPEAYLGTQGADMLPKIGGAWKDYIKELSVNELIELYREAFPYVKFLIVEQSLDRAEADRSSLFRSIQSIFIEDLRRKEEPDESQRLHGFTKNGLDPRYDALRKAALSNFYRLTEKSQKNWPKLLLVRFCTANWGFVGGGDVFDSPAEFRRKACSPGNLEYYFDNVKGAGTSFSSDSYFPEGFFESESEGKYVVLKEEAERFLEGELLEKFLAALEAQVQNEPWIGKYQSA